MSTRHRILVVTAGLNQTSGSSNSYQEALMDGLTARGHSLASLSLAEIKSSPGLSWEKTSGQITRYQIFNGGLYPGRYGHGGVGTTNPQRDIAGTPGLADLVLEIIQRERPEVVHIQSFFGLPLELVARIRALGAKTLYTAHDYFPLCATAHLFRPDASPCRLAIADMDCVSCCRQALPFRAFWFATLLERAAERNPPGRWLYRLRNLTTRAARRLNQSRTDNRPYVQRAQAAAHALHAVDLVQAISSVQAVEFQRIAGPLANLRILPVVSPGLVRRTPVERPATPGRPLVVAALNINGIYKGAGLIRELALRLQATGVRWELHLYGPNRLDLDLPTVHQHGRYHVTDLDRIAAHADLCLMPSIWSETLGFVGLEMMARGTPLVVSRQSGASEYVNSDVSGIIFDAAKPDDLFQRMARLIDQPELVAELRTGLNRQLSAGADGVRPIRTFSEHLTEMESLFSELAHRG